MQGITGGTIKIEGVGTNELAFKDVEAYGYTRPSIEIHNAYSKSPG